MNTDLTVGKPWKVLLKYILPLFGSAVFQRTVLYRQRTPIGGTVRLYSDNAPLFPLAVNGVSVQVKGQLGRGIFLAVH